MFYKGCSCVVVRMARKLLIRPAKMRRPDKFWTLSFGKKRRDWQFWTGGKSGAKFSEKQLITSKVKL